MFGSLCPARFKIEFLLSRTTVLLMEHCSSTLNGVQETVANERQWERNAAGKKPGRTVRSVMGLDAGLLAVDGLRPRVRDVVRELGVPCLHDCIALSRLSFPYPRVDL